MTCEGLHKPSVQVRSTDSAVLLAGCIALVERYCAGSGGPSFSTSEESTGWRVEGKRMGGSTRRVQNGDGSGRVGCHEPEIGIPFAGMSEFGPRLSQVTGVLR